MFRTLISHLRGSAWLLALALLSYGISPHTRASDNVLAVLDGAETRFTPPTPSWFYETQNALRAEMAVVGEALDAQGSEYAKPWKEHLRWSLLEKNLGPPDTIDVSEIEFARRWMYSNRKGLEMPFFAKLRSATDAYLDAAYTLSRPDLQAEFNAYIELARKQIADLIREPTDTHAAALGRTLGWLERTGQLTVETAELRTTLSRPNAQIVVTKPLIQKIMSTQSPVVEQILAVSDRGEAPPTRRFQMPRTVHVRGTAHTVGSIALELVPNTQQAELSIVYNGKVDSLCTAHAGPVSFKMRTIGPMSASKPVTFGPSGIEYGVTTVIPHVRTNVTSITADSNFVRRIGERRVNDPQNKSYMSSRARAKAVQLLEGEMDTRVEEAIEEIRAEIMRARSQAEEFSEVFAPLVREGATISFDSTGSDSQSVAVNINSGRREQLGAATACPEVMPEADVQMRVHVSFVNNLMETIMAGKVFTDEYFMKYAKVLQPTLPLPLMVHSRAKRWAIVAAKPRPLELTIPAPHQFTFKLRIASFELDSEKFDAPTTATVRYKLVRNEFDEYFLERTEDIELESSLSSAHQDFLHEKLSAFFSPVLDGGGVSVPDGGSIGSLNMLKFLGLHADQDWLVLGIGVPQEFVDKAMKSTGSAHSPATDSNEVPTLLPPAYAIDADLSSYPISQ